MFSLQKKVINKWGEGQKSTHNVRRKDEIVWGLNLLTTIIIKNIYKNQLYSFPLVYDICIGITRYRRETEKKNRFICSDMERFASWHRTCTFLLYYYAYNHMYVLWCIYVINKWIYL